MLSLVRPGQFSIDENLGGGEPWANNVYSGSGVIPDRVWLVFCKVVFYN